MKLTTVTDEEEASPTQNTEANVDAIWTTESLENATLRHESSSEEEREASTASTVPLEEITNDSPVVWTESPMESTTYRYDGATELEDRPDAGGTRDRENPVNSGEEDGTIIPVAIFEPQRDVLPPEQAGSPPPANNNSLSPANHGDSPLLLDKPATDETENDSTPADEETTTDLVDEVRGNEENAKMSDLRESSPSTRLFRRQ